MSPGSPVLQLRLQPLDGALQLGLALVATVDLRSCLIKVAPRSCHLPVPVGYPASLVP
jgi:hypothetical protein